MGDVVKRNRFGWRIASRNCRQCWFSSEINHSGRREAGGKHERQPPHGTLEARQRKVASGLSYRERESIRLRNGLAEGCRYTLEEVGTSFALTRERVRQIESKAVRKLQQSFCARSLHGFLDGVEEPVVD